MKEKEGKSAKKNVIKIVAIVFVVVLLLLTFFSNTIMNYSLPEVSTVYVEGGSVSNKVRCQGSTELGDSVDINVSGERVIKKILVKSGDVVEKDQVLVEFDEEDNKELREARKNLASLRLEYEKDQLDSGIDNSDLVDAIDNAQDDLNKANRDLTKAQEDTAKLNNLKNELAALQQQLAQLEQQLADMGETPEGEEDSDEKKALIEQIEAVKAAIEAKQAEIDAIGEVPSIEDAADTVHEKEKALANARKAYQKKLQEDAITVQENALNSEAKLAEIREAEKLVEKLEKQDDTANVKATVAGTVGDFTIKEGDTVNNEAPLMSITPKTDVYKVKCNITIEESKLIKVGDEADIENIWDDGCSAVVSAINPDPANPGKGRIVVFDVTGEYIEAGDLLMLAVGERSLKSETVVPNNAVKEGSDGKFVLVVKVKGTPLGNRYTVMKKKVEVVAKDSAHSALKGEIEPYDNVVTNSSKPLEDGQQVRLTEE